MRSESIGITYVAVARVRSGQASSSLYGKVAPLAVIMGSRLKDANT